MTERLKTKAVRRLVSVTLAVLLLTAEIFALTHPLDAAAHSGADPCKICLSVGGFGAAVAPHHPPPAIVAAAAVVPPALAPALVALRREAPVARGPPVLS